jgi:hypothetical protein
MLYCLACRHGAGWSPGEQLRFAVRLATAKVQQEGFQGLGSRMFLNKTQDTTAL